MLINIFEQVLTSAVGCVLVNRSAARLETVKEEIQYLNHELSKYDDRLLALQIREVAEKVLQELDITSIPLLRYIEISLPTITLNITQAVNRNTLDKVFVAPVNPNLKPKIQFLTGVKMDDEEYRKLIDELLVCRNSSDKLELIKEKVKSFGDLEDILADATLSEKEVTSVFDILGNAEIAVLVKRHPYNLDIQAVDLSESEQMLRLHLKNYINELPINRQKKILEMVDQLIVM